MCNRFLETGNEDLRFLHFYLRFKNHSNSRAMEEKVIKGDLQRYAFYIVIGTLITKVLPSSK